MGRDPYRIRHRHLAELACALADIQDLQPKNGVDIEENTES